MKNKCNITLNHSQSDFGEEIGNELNSEKEINLSTQVLRIV